MKRLVCCVAVLLIAFSGAAQAVGSAAEPHVSAVSAVLYDPLTGRMLFEKDAHTRRGMASTTKIMTAALALQLYDSDAAVEIQPQWTGVEGSSMYLKAGEQMHVSDLIYGLMLMSGNDAAKALACLHSGDEADFVALMNQKALDLGLENTSFQTPSGLDGDSHYSTAYDMALIAAWAMENDAFAEIALTKSAQRAGRYMTNHNKLLKTLDGAVGIKTGYTKASGRCLVSACVRQGRMLIAVTLNAPDDWDDHQALFDYGFDGMETTQILSSGIIGAVPIAGGGSVELYIQQDLSLALDAGELAQLKVELCGPRIHYGGAKAGEVWGKARVKIGGASVFSADVFFADDTRETPPETGFVQAIINFLRKLVGEHH